MMKIVLIGIFILFQFANCLSQKLFKTASEIQRIKENKNLFIGKPLKVLQKETATYKTRNGAT